MDSEITILSKLFYEKVLPRYEEVKDERYVIKYSKVTRRRALAEIQKVSGQFRTPDYYILTMSTETYRWDDKAKSALMAHELGHLLVWKEFLPTTGNLEESISLQAVGRGFGEGIRKIFEQYCQEPCWRIARGANKEIVIIGASRNIGGITCSFKVLGSQYCPFSEKKPKLGLLTYIDKPTVACTICATRIKKTALKCENCQSQFHLKCIDPWLRRESNCPICKVILIEEYQQQ